LSTWPQLASELAGCRLPVPAQRVLQEAGELGVSVGDVGGALAAVAQRADHITQGQLATGGGGGGGGARGGRWKERSKQKQNSFTMRGYQF